MEKVYLRYPDDKEGAIFYALALNATASPSDRTYSNQKEGRSDFERDFFRGAAEPPGRSPLSHSQLRLSRRLPNWGLSAAICYSKIAPSVPHALHMPSHIFTRLGKWQESVHANRASLAAWPRTTRFVTMARAWPGISRCTPWTISNTRTCNLGKTMPQKSLSTMSMPSVKRRQRRLVLHMQWRPFRRAMPWSEGIGSLAANLSLPSATMSWSSFPWTKAMISYARALGAARTGDVAGARMEIEHLQSAHDALVARNKYWADQIEVQRLAAASMLSHAQGRDADALSELTQASDLEASMEKNPVTPGGIVPAHELLGDLLLEAQSTRTSLEKAYEQTLATDPESPPKCIRCR